MGFKNFHEDLSRLQGRLILVVVVMTLFFLSVGVRLYFLQIHHGAEYRLFAYENTLKEVRIPAVRGLIKDRDGRIIATSRPSFNLALIPQYIQDINSVAMSIEALSSIPQEVVLKAWPKAKRQPSFYPYVVAQDIGFDVMSKLHAYQAVADEKINLHGVEVIAQPVRRYPNESMAANTLGYVRETSKEELKRLQAAVPGSYHLGARAGAFGLERGWEVLLRGRDGYQQKFVNAVGREVSSDRVGIQLAHQAAIPGNNMVTTLDLRLQGFAEKLFADKTGALVAMDPFDGEILAMVSAPSFDLNELANKISSEKWQQLINDPGKLFLNRAIQSAYPPGSTYKMVVAAGGLEEGVITPEEKIKCPGYLTFGRRRFHCWKRGGHGAVNVHRAIVGSCDVFFYTVGNRLGVDRIAKYAHKFGLGQRSGIYFKGETNGLIPTKEWKQRVRKEKWHPGETLSISIGQGYDLVSPLQNALMVAAIANGGFLVTPKFVRHFLDPANKRIIPPSYLFSDRRKAIGISADTMDRIKKAMIGVVAEPGGTAGRLRALPVSAGGKTGTAQVVGLKSGKVGKQYRDHALFVSFAPAEHPEIVVSVIVEHGGHGSSSAAPIAGKVIEEYIRLKRGEAESEL